MDELTLRNYNAWNEFQELPTDLKDELASLSEDRIEDAFYKDLSFGTGGLRGVIGVGTNRMNVLTVAKASQGLANYVLKNSKKPSIAISYDSRIKSREFAEKAASVFAANGIHVFIYSSLSPVPTLSFATRYHHCDAGVMITASHNPSKYNGYKVYGPDGCQITTEGAKAVLSEIQNLDVFHDAKSISFDEGIVNGLIEYIKPDCLDEFIKNVEEQSLLGNERIDRNVAIVYTPLNGTGLVPVTRVLGDLGFGNVSIVEEQRNPDGHFPTCPYPNPEIEEAMSLGMKVAAEKGADLLLATDPDCDRVGSAVKGKDGKFVLISGNQMGLLLLQYTIERRAALGTMPKRPVLVKTIVTTDMADKIAKENNIEVINVLTGFKFIGEQIALLEKQGRASDYLFGFEESYGYLSGTYVRDKDGVVGAMLIAEMFAYYHSKGKSLLDVLEDIYRKYGYSLNTLHFYEFDGPKGFKKMVSIMDGLREDEIKSINGYAVNAIEDYSLGLNGLPKSNVLKFRLDGGDTVTIRPSGTEPKLKLYVFASGNSEDEATKKEETLRSFFEERFK